MEGPIEMYNQMGMVRNAPQSGSGAATTVQPTSSVPSIDPNNWQSYRDYLKSNLPKGWNTDGDQTFYSPEGGVYALDRLQGSLISAKDFSRLTPQDAGWGAQPQAPAQAQQPSAPTQPQAPTPVKTQQPGPITQPAPNTNSAFPFPVAEDPVTPVNLGNITTPGDPTKPYSMASWLAAGRPDMAAALVNMEQTGLNMALQKDIFGKQSGALDTIMNMLNQGATNAPDLVNPLALSPGDMPTRRRVETGPFTTELINPGNDQAGLGSVGRGQVGMIEDMMNNPVLRDIIQADRTQTANYGDLGSPYMRQQSSQGMIRPPQIKTSFGADGSTRYSVGGQSFNTKQEADNFAQLKMQELAGVSDMVFQKAPGSLGAQSPQANKGSQLAENLQRAMVSYGNQGAQDATDYGALIGRQSTQFGDLQSRASTGYGDLQSRASTDYGDLVGPEALVGLDGSSVAAAKTSAEDAFNPQLAEMRRLGGMSQGGGSAMQGLQFLQKQAGSRAATSEQQRMNDIVLNQLLGNRELATSQKLNRADFNRQQQEARLSEMFGQQLDKAGFDRQQQEARLSEMFGQQLDKADFDRQQQEARLSEMFGQQLAKGDFDRQQDQLRAGQRYEQNVSEAGFLRDQMLDNATFERDIMKQIADTKQAAQMSNAERDAQQRRENYQFGLGQQEKRADSTLNQLLGLRDSKLASQANLDERDFGLAKSNADLMTQQRLSNAEKTWAQQMDAIERERGYADSDYAEQLNRYRQAQDSLAAQAIANRDVPFQRTMNLLQLLLDGKAGDTGSALTASLIAASQNNAANADRAAAAQQQAAADKQNKWLQYTNIFGALGGLGGLAPR